MRVLIVGAAGFAGRYLARELLARGHEVWGGTRSGGSDEAPAPRSGGPARPDDLPPIRLLRCDVTRAREVEVALEEARPDAVALLAGVAWPPAANLDPPEAYLVHGVGTATLLTAAARLGRPVRVLVVTSSEVYGPADATALPLTEESPLRPATIYAASKAAADLAAAAFAISRACDVVRARPFNHTGPGQRRDFVCPDFAAQVAAIVRGRRPPVIEVGNLEVRRDFSDVRDVVRGYAAALEQGRGGEAYNLCSGRATSIREILETLCELGGIRPEIRRAEGRWRSGEVPALWGSWRKAERDLGWRPAIELRRTLEDVLARALQDDA